MNIGKYILLESSDFIGVTIYYECSLTSFDDTILCIMSWNANIILMISF